MATTEILFNPFDPAFHRDPYPFYHRLRVADPVHTTPLGFVVLTRYDDVLTLLRDPRFGREGFHPMLAASQPSPTNPEPLPPSMLFQDPPVHTRLRALVTKAFTPRAVEAMRPQIQAIVDRLLDRAQEAGRMDVIDDLAYPLPVTVICEMLGVPTDAHAAIKGWSADLARSLDAIGLPAADEIRERGVQARRALADYFRTLLPERRRRPGPDLLSALLEVEEQGDRLTEPELLSMLILLFVAGHETTVNLIGNGVLALLRHPAELARLRREPGLAASAVEELLRWDSPVQRTARTPATDVEIAGHTIPRGTLVVGAIGAANRDPAHFPDPDRLDVGRADNRHLSFGFGIHFCLGASLARLEGQIAIDTLVRRAPALELAPGELEWRQSSTLRGLVALPVTL